jgi:hypothetical protein
LRFASKMEQAHRKSRQVAAPAHRRGICAHAMSNPAADASDASSAKVSAGSLNLDRRKPENTGTRRRCPDRLRARVALEQGGSLLVFPAAAGFLFALSLALAESFV